MTCFCYLRQDLKGNPEPEYVWPSDDWMELLWLDPEAEWEPEANESEDELEPETSKSEDEVETGASESEDKSS